MNNRIEKRVAETIEDLMIDMNLDTSDFNIGAELLRMDFNRLTDLTAKEVAIFHETTVAHVRKVQNQIIRYMQTYSE